MDWLLDAVQLEEFSWWLRIVHHLLFFFVCFITCSTTEKVNTTDTKATYCKGLQQQVFSLRAVFFKILQMSVEYLTGTYAGRELDDGPKGGQQGDDSHRQWYGDLVQKHSSLLLTVRALMTLHSKKEEKLFICKMPLKHRCHFSVKIDFKLKTNNIFSFVRCKKKKKRHSLSFWSCCVLSQCTGCRKLWTARDKETDEWHVKGRNGTGFMGVM